MTEPKVLLGVDVEHVARWRAMLPELAGGAQRRLFTEREHADCSGFQDPAPHYAARWCAKEATVKALASVARITVRDVEILRHPDGRPSLVLHAPGLEWVADAVALSMSHTSEIACAVAVGLR